MARPAPSTGLEASGGDDDWDPEAGGPPSGAVIAHGGWGDKLPRDAVLATGLGALPQFV